MKLTEWLDGRLVPEWRDAWRFSSVQLSAIAAAAGGVITANPELLLSLAAMLPMGGPWQIALIFLVVVSMFVIPALSRLWSQGGDDDDATEA